MLLIIVYVVSCWSYILISYCKFTKMSQAANNILYYFKMQTSNKLSTIYTITYSQIKIKLRLSRKINMILKFNLISKKTVSKQHLLKGKKSRYIAYFYLQVLFLPFFLFRRRFVRCWNIFIKLSPSLLVYKMLNVSYEYFTQIIALWNTSSVKSLRLLSNM